MPNQLLPKYAIECQGCQDSLTIVYSAETANPGEQEKYKKHLVALMDYHIKYHPGPLPDPVPVPELKWVQTIRPIPKA